MKTFFSRRKKRDLQHDEVSLQITSMADIFTILLVFLLKGYASGALQITPSPGVRIPTADGAPLSEEALQVEISGSAVQVGGRPVAELREFALAGGGAGLLNAFKRERSRRNLIAKTNDQVKDDGKILVLADERTPYATVKLVLRSAAIHGFSDLRLAVLKE